MKSKYSCFVLLVLVFEVLFISGCITKESSLKETDVSNISSSISEVANTTISTTIVYDDKYPTIKTTLSPSNPSLGRNFTLMISAEDDKGLKQLSWESSKSLSNQGKAGSFECNLQKNCSNTWEFTTSEEGPHEITAYATDSSNQSGKAALKVDVGPYRQTTNTTTQSTSTSTSNNTATTNQTVTNQTNQTTNQTTAGDNSCTSNSDCGYKQICTNKNCQSVECTNNAHCSGCKRCSSNNCVSCGYGPYGCYC
mgnify:CR=1 FL=1